MNTGSNRLEAHFDAFFENKGKKAYRFDPKKLSVKDRKIIQTLRTYKIRNRVCLDIGPGTGRWLRFLKQEGSRFNAAVDISNESIKRCEPLCDTIQKADIESDELAFESDFFDIIIVFEVLEHIRYPEQLLSEMFRVAKPNGLILMSVPNTVSLISRMRMCLGQLPVSANDPTHVKFYRAKDIRRLFQRHRMTPEFIATSISLNPLNPKSRLCLKSMKVLRSFDDTLLFKVIVQKNAQP